MAPAWTASYAPRRYFMPAEVQSAPGHRSPFFRIAIDGPAAGGKSSTARTLAARLGFRYVDTAAMTEDARFAFMLDAPPATASDVLRPPRVRVTVNAEDVTEEIRSPVVTRAVAAIARLPTVRARMLQKQRAFGTARETSAPGLVMDGRDIGSVVFPDAELKVFLTAQLEARAQRRFRELMAKQPTPLTPAEQEAAYNALVADIQARDQSDEKRAVSPLIRASDAVLLDTSSMSFAEQVAAIEHLVRARMTPSPQ
ncbi:Cytidylate kinase-domain-containing protein [Syncephalis pseudoplumigaleata]|uniref:(d)CMP kinase n=1 Tax=Syncephalis pseudoplumigaleata TaxID=1712513 RepID=A0A4P9Z1E1_9FUNG|nr:Cytidylate kinase-domain-containing protein [Syncephalis pseudoplumigaleata]|eukprot:RKP26297.1 Cytidylate kinase-domain-containing protein [Syncephalis pseudoplumigaleata]